jgi:hypothetical protein
MKYNKIKHYVKWQCFLDYKKKLSPDQQQYIYNFFDAYFSGDFRNDIFNNNKFKRNYLKSIKADPSEYAEFQKQYEKQCRKGKISEVEFSLTYLKRKVWRYNKREMKNNEETFGINDYSIEAGRLEETKIEITPNMVKDLKLDDFDDDLIFAIKEKKLPEFFNKWLSYMLEIEYVNTKRVILLKFMELVEENWEMYSNNNRRKYKYFAFVSYLNKVFKNNLADEENRFLSEKIELIFENYIYSKKNLYVKGLFK